MGKAVVAAIAVQLIVAVVAWTLAGAWLERREDR